MTNARRSSNFSNCPTLISHAICWRAMSPPTPDTPPCVAYCFRIELNASRFAAALWLAWLALVGAVAVSASLLPWSIRVAFCLAVWVPGVRCIRSFVLLDGPHAVRSIEWSEEGDFGVCLGPQRDPHPATLAAGSFRLGSRWWVLRFITPVGLRPVLIAGGVQDEEGFRRLSRCLTTHLRRASGRSTGPAVTIRPKV